ncbi:unnamed protein product [Ascophyllum nodosum]
MIGTRNVVIFAGNTILAEQMRYDVTDALDLKDGDELNYRITICLINSGTKILSRDPKFWNNYGMAVYDECHKFCAEKSKQLMCRVACDYKLSLSATVIKFWNHLLIFHCSGNMIMEINT